MSDHETHYRDLLAEHYSWMFGDYDAAVDRFRAMFADRGIVPKGSGRALDLGAGSGFQTIALAQLGFTVTAIDRSEALLAELGTHAAGMRIETALDDLLNLQAHAPEPVELIVCMGDVLTHLRSMHEVTDLVARAYDALEPEGRLVLGYRDLTTELKGTDRFLPIRADADRVFTCFLEYGPTHVTVNDVVYSREGEGWRLQKSSFPKLRVPPHEVAHTLRAHGFEIDEDTREGIEVVQVGRRG
ncbi:MAG: class I SAM-dependent methyltransferase [Myxococcales bacterium]|nr:class I SAM-dependent methyltransferase [Myxococcales bacterium]